MRIRVNTLRHLIKEALKSLKEGVSVPSIETVQQLGKKFPKGLKSIGINASDINSWPSVGVGTHGIAFDIGEGKVFKITNDSQEASAAATLVGKSVKNIVQFYNVVKFGNTGLFGVLQEKVEPLEQSEAKEFNDAIVATGLPVWIKNADNDWSDIKKMVKQYIVRNIKKKFPDDHNSPEARTFIKTMNSHWNTLITKFGMRDIFMTLNDLGIKFHDYHAGNLMKREDGTFVLIDLGISKIVGGGGDMKMLIDVDINDQD